MKYSNNAPNLPFYMDSVNRDTERINSTRGNSEVRVPTLAIFRTVWFATCFCDTVGMTEGRQMDFLKDKVLYITQ